jgi:hypothetical protein
MIFSREKSWKDKDKGKLFTVEICNRRKIFITLITEVINKQEVIGDNNYKALILRK